MGDTMDRTEDRTTERAVRERNAHDRDRLRRLAGAADAALRRPLADGWTVAAVLVHLAFWDRWVEERWERYGRDGIIEELPDGILDLANAAGLPGWLAVEPGAAAALALDAAEAVDRRIAALAPAAVVHALTTGRPAMVDRSLHRGPHLDEIERTLAA